MGTELINHGLKLPLPLWSADCNLTHPEVVLKIHQDNINAGADYITTNTFRTTHRAYLQSGLSGSDAENRARQSLEAAVTLAKKAAYEKGKVIGSIAPLEDCYSPQLFPGKEIAEREFSQLVHWLTKSKIDIILFETMNNIPEIEAGLKTVENSDIPAWVSLFLRDENRLASTESFEECIDVIQKYPVDCILLNCSSLEITEKAIVHLSKIRKGSWGIYPNLGVGNPAVDGNIKHFSSDADFLKTIQKAVDLGANAIGGCCGTTSGHTKMLSQHFKK